MKKRETHIVQGMSRDLATARFNPNMVYDARNIRITARKDKSSLLSVTNEKGTASVTVSGDTISGTIIGTAVLNNVLVLFTTGSSTDRIYKLVFTNNYNTVTSYKLFEGSLQFDVTKPIETLPIYENEQIQKVYWVDGINQPRVINISGNSLITNPDIFNFNRKISGIHTMTITKSNSGGEFPAGTIQYCFNYFNKFGQETNIVDVSPLYYLCPKEKGLPADTVDTSLFTINFSNLDTNYEYIRVYSIIRTSENAVPNVRIVGDYRLQNAKKRIGRTMQYADVTIDTDKLYIVDSTTLTKKYLLSERWTIPNTETRYTLEANEYLYDDELGIIYFYEFDYEERRDFFISQSGGEYTLYAYDGLGDWKLYEGTIYSGIIGDITLVDNGLIGSTLDATALLFIGGQDIVAGTIANKDNTLFLGDIKQNVPSIGQLMYQGTSLKDLIKGKAEACSFDENGDEIYGATGYDEGDIDVVSGYGFYDYPIDNNKSSYDTKYFKARENYRLGFIAQYNTGQWSEVLWIDDLDETFAPGGHVFYKGYNDELKWGGIYRKPGFKATLSESITATLINVGFIRVAPVVVYPSFSERKVICQGLLAGTVYNIGDRYENAPFAQADWRFRNGYADTAIDGEIQCNTEGAAPEYPVVNDSNHDPISTLDFVGKYSNQYYRDSSILTFHSPDIELDDNLTSRAIENAKLRIVGFSNLGFDENKVGLYPRIVADANIITETQGYDEASGVVSFEYPVWGYSIRRGQDGVLINPPEWDNYRDKVIGDLAYIGFTDVALDEQPTGDEKGKIIPSSTSPVSWLTYIWHRNGSLNDQRALSADALKFGSKRYAVLKKKCISEFKYARSTFFQSSDCNTVGPFEIPLNISAPKIFSSEQNELINIDFSEFKNRVYYGNIDKVIVPPFVAVSANQECPVSAKETKSISADGYPIQSILKLDTESRDFDITTDAYGGSSEESAHRNYDGTVETSGYLYARGKDPVHMTYKTTKHAVIGLKTFTGSDVINQLAEVPTPSSYAAYWDGNNSKTHTDVLSGVFDDSIYDGFTGVRKSLLIAELYRDAQENPDWAAARFGGTSDEAILNDVWVRCGESKQLLANSQTILYYREGDTYYGRYDFLKSYPYTEEDQNQIVSIYSTEIESRVNLDTRYDKNRGLMSNLYVRPTNFNQFNRPGYEQTNQYFTYRTIDYSRYNFYNYPNMLTWSLEKKIGADIDAWTSITLTATADARGDLGKVTKLTCFNDSVFLFQPRGVAQVLFNERVQIPTSDGQPIEITNGLKFGGLRYFSNQIGLTNKWSLCETPYGIYFVDDEKNTLYQFAGQQFKDLSGTAGLKTWFESNNSYKIWNPSEYKNIRTFYDKLNGDIYLMTKDESLVYSEQAGVFTSFMDYANLPMMVNMNDKFFTYNNAMYELFAGDYNYFFGTYKPYWLTFLSNTDPTIDKVFDNLAWRTIDYTGSTLQPLTTFDTLRVWNEHQDTGDTSLYDTLGKPSSLKKKFNVFRALVPRDKYGSWKGKGINRIRDTWAYVQLKRVTANKDYMQFLDLDVDFFE